MQQHYFRAAVLRSRCSLLSYANTGLTSAVRSKQGRGILGASLPPFRLTLSPPLQPLSVPHTRTLTALITHHAYLSGATLPPRVGFYQCIRLISTQTAPWKDIPTQHRFSSFSLNGESRPPLLKVRWSSFDWRKKYCGLLAEGGVRKSLA